MATVSQLRQVVLRARADPAIARCRYWRHLEWVGDAPVHDCGGERLDYVQAGITDHDCCCGQRHRTFRCHRCGAAEAQPVEGPGCGRVPRPD